MKERYLLKPTMGVLSKIPKTQKLQIEGFFGVYEGFISIDKCNKLIKIHYNIERDFDDYERFIRIDKIQWVRYIHNPSDFEILLDELFEKELTLKT